MVQDNDMNVDFVVVFLIVVFYRLSQTTNVVWFMNLKDTSHPIYLIYAFQKVAKPV